MASNPPTTRLDVRELGDGDPFTAITAALDELGEDERLVLVNSFEPTPLYAVLTGRGFAYETTQVAADEWHVEITHDTRSDSGEPTH